MKIIHITPENRNTHTFTDNDIVGFLYKNLDQYGDSEEAITACLNFAMKHNGGLGGFVLLAVEDDTIIGAVIINKTGMQGYIPENILVYIAAHRRYRGKGVGKALMDAVLKHSIGDIALHVEKDNPARFMYEKYGFMNPYLEMRLKR